MADFEMAVVKTIRREGGETVADDPKDPGGLTKYGISKRAHPEVDIRNLTLQMAKDIYAREYWAPVHGAEIASQVKAELLFDTAVNMGVSQAVKLAQVASDVPPAGEMTPQTLLAVQEMPEQDCAAAFVLAKMARYVYLVRKNKSLEKFFFGWISRALEI